VREYPVFVPWRGEDHLAAVIAVPERDPRGLVVLCGVPGAPRSHRYQMWARAAERLCEEGVASIRWEYRGLDDSTGAASEVSMAVTPIDQTIEVTRFAQRAVGVDKVVGVGNCMGAQSALSLAAELEECMGAVCFLPQLTKQRAGRRAFRRAARGQLRFLRSRLVRGLVIGPLSRFGPPMRPTVREPLPRALEHARVLFVYDREHLDARSRAFPKIRAVVNRLPESHRGRFELRVLPSWGLDRFGSLESQESALDAILDWVGRCLDGEGSASHAMSATTGPAAESSERHRGPQLRG
jgi:pimeloyl-ACP methyl ester carboxylesterase